MTSPPQVRDVFTISESWQPAAHWAWWQIAIERIAGAGYGGVADQSDRGLEVLCDVAGTIEIHSIGRWRHAEGTVL